MITEISILIKRPVIKSLVSETIVFNDWFLPSKDELQAMYDNLYLHGVGNFSGSVLNRYWSSSEYDSDYVYVLYFTTGLWGSYFKTTNNYVRHCRTFTSSVVYALRDVGPAGGLIFNIVDNGTDYTYLEAGNADISLATWGNITDQLIGTTSTAIGTGQANTTAIINQAGHTASAAKLCDDIAIDASDVLINTPKCGYYVRWFYNGFHYWHFLSEQESLLTEGEKYNTLGKTKVRLYSGQLNDVQIAGLWPLMRAKDVSVYISGVWKTLLIDPGSLVTYRNQIAGYEFEVNATIGALQAPLVIPEAPVIYTTPPAFYSAEVGLIASNILVIRFDHLLQIVTPSSFAFTPSFSGGAVTVTNVVITDVGGYYYVYLTLSRDIVFGETGTIQYDPNAMGSELLTGWTNEGGTTGFDTLTTSGKNITSAIDASGTTHQCYTNILNLTIDKPVKITIDLTLNSGTAPRVLIRKSVATYDLYLNQNTINGENEIIFTPTITQGYRLYFYSTVNQNFSAICSVKEMTNRLIGVDPYDAEVYAFNQPVVNNVADLTAPAVTSITVSGDIITITLDKDQDTSIFPYLLAFVITFSGGNPGIDLISMDLRHIYVNLDRNIANGETGNITYNPNSVPEGRRFIGLNSVIVGFFDEPITNLS